MKMSSKYDQSGINKKQKNIKKKTAFFSPSHISNINFLTLLCHITVGYLQSQHVTCLWMTSSIIGDLLGALLDFVFSSLPQFIWCSTINPSTRLNCFASKLNLNFRYNIIEASTTLNFPKSQPICCFSLPSYKLTLNFSVNIELGQSLKATLIGLDMKILIIKLTQPNLSVSEILNYIGECEEARIINSMTLFTLTARKLKSNLKIGNFLSS